MKRRALFLASALVAAGCPTDPEDDELDGRDDLMADDDDGDEGGGDEVPANAYCDPVAAWDPPASAAEERVRVLVNEARAAGAVCGGQQFSAVGPLAMDPALRCAARVHSLDMATRGFFDHDNPDGESPFVRIERAGYMFFAAGENIAAGQPTPEEVVAGWLDSPGHCMNIMSPDFSEIGVGYVATQSAPFPHYWTQTFGG